MFNFIYKRSAVCRHLRFLQLSVLFILYLYVPAELFSDDDTLSVLSFNLWNYFVDGEESKPVKSEKSRDAVAKTISSVKPDIIMVCEIGGRKSLNDLVEHLKKYGCEYSYSDVMTGCDSWRQLGVIAKFKPVIIDKEKDLTYRIHPKKSSKSALDTVPVQRGFFHLVFEKGDYRFHIISAHLKAKLFHPRYNQTDMRRFEARLLRYSVDKILKKNPDANILVVGDLNDNYSSDPLNVIRGDKLKENKRLVDLKFHDKWNCTWTHWWKNEDSYSRIDYTLVSKGMLPEIDMKKSYIVHIPDLWPVASDHRPIVTVIKTEDK